MRIALLLEEGSTASSVSTTLDMLRLATRFQPEAGWSPELYSTSGGAVQLTDTLTIETKALPASLADFNAVVLPGFFADSMECLVRRLHSTWHEVIARLRAAPHPALVAGSCYGTFVLAEAGLLDNLPATTTWWLAEAFHQRYPKVRLDADEALVDGGRAITAGAMTAHTDLVLHILRRFGGVALARRVGSIMLVDGARTLQRPFMLIQRDFDDPLVSQAANWLEDRLGQPIAIEELAEAIHVSYRTLNRRFTAIAGMAPLAYLQALRIERAKEMLEISDAGFEAITEQVGYGDASSFRRLFKRMTGLSPAQYRKQFSHKAR